MHDCEELRKGIVNCKTDTIIGAILKQGIIDLNSNIISEYTLKHSRKNPRKVLRKKAIDYLQSDLCRFHCNLIDIDYNSFIERISILVEKSKKELTVSYQ